MSARRRSPAPTKTTLLALAAILAACSGSCADDGFGTVKGKRRLVVELLSPSNSGTREQPLPLAIDAPITFKIRVRALLPDGQPDTAFSSYVRISAKPGAIAPIAGAGEDAHGRNILLRNGASEPVDVQLGNAFGTTYILAEDLGYIPSDPLRKPPPQCFDAGDNDGDDKNRMGADCVVTPQCSDGVDNDGDGTIDYPADPGCAFANDDTELGGTFEQGASPPIFFTLPRVADVRGLRCDAARVCSGSGITPYQKDQVQIDTGHRQSQDGTTSFAFDTVVVRVSSNGFFVTDTGDPRGGGFTSLYAFNFNAPPRMRVCDRIKSLAGTTSEFFGLTQISYPTWTLEEWDPSKRPCLVPEPTVLRTSDLTDPTLTQLLAFTGSLVRAQTTPERTYVTRVGGKLGPGDVPTDAGGNYQPGPDATNCDYNQDGKIDFALGAPEGLCSQACTNDLECIEYSNFKARSTFRLVVEDVNKLKGAIQADASAATGFDVLAHKGKELRSFSGTLVYFSGGSQYTIEARCADDIVVPLDKEPPPSFAACVSPRTPSELNPQ